MHHIAVNPNKNTYKFQIINLDQQKDVNFDVKIVDSSTTIDPSTASNFNVYRYNNFQN